MRFMVIVPSYQGGIRFLEKLVSFDAFHVTIAKDYVVPAPMTRQCGPDHAGTPGIVGPLDGSLHD